MAARLNPYISMPGTARQAMEFYQSVFGGDLSVSTFGEFGTEGPDADKIMHSQLETPSGFTLMLSDTSSDQEYKPGTNMSVSLSGDSADDLRAYWDRLSEGGTVTLPLDKQTWGDQFGMVVDRFGVPWMVNISQSPG